MASFQRGITFATNGTVTAENLHNLVDQTTPRAGIITDRSVLATMSTADRVLIADTDDATNAYFITTGSLIGQGLAGTTYAGASFSAGTIATFNSTTGTVTNLTASTATISTLSGNTTGGTYSGNIVATAGTVTTLTASTLTGSLTGGTYSGNVIATAGTVTSLTSSTGTITNLTTTLAGDFTISGGTGTLGTTGVTAGTYGNSTIIPSIAVDAKGRVTSVGTSAVSTGKILQVVSTNSTSVVSANVSIPSDNTIPQNTEGSEVLTLSITPVSATSTLYILFSASGEATFTNRVVCALFKDSNADAITAIASYNDGPTHYILQHSEVSGSTSARTYKIRTGPSGAASGTIYFNSNTSGNAIFGGVSRGLFMKIMEVEA